jgi:YaiO family outer membrane protein
MKNCRRYIASAGCLFLLLLSVAAQTPPTEPGDAQPAATPDSRTNTTTQPKPSPELSLEFGVDYEALSNNHSDWQTYFFRFNRKFSSGQLLYGEAAVVHRFDLTDPSLMIGWYQPLNRSRSWTTNLEVSGSPTHDVLAAFSLYGRIERNFGKGWLGHAGLRHSRYSDNNVNTGVFGVEKYFKAYRGAYTLYVAHLNGSGTSTSHAFQGNYYYGERNSTGMGVAFGQEIESVGNGRFIRTDVREVSLIGRHWFNQKWGLSYVALWHRQGNAYTRSGAQVGVLLRL